MVCLAVTLGKVPEGGLADIHNRKGEHGDGSEGSQADGTPELTGANGSPSEVRLGRGPRGLSARMRE